MLCIFIDLRILVGNCVIATHWVTSSVTRFEGKIQAEKVQDSLTSVKDGSQGAGDGAAGDHDTRRRCSGRRCCRHWTCRVGCDVEAGILTVGL